MPRAVGKIDTTTFHTNAQSRGEGLKGRLKENKLNAGSQPPILKCTLDH